MKLIIAEHVPGQLRRELRRAGTREIGGVLVGEHVADGTFKIVDLSVQRNGGTSSHFVRDPAYHEAFLAEFFKKTGDDYERFNYIGEWHSHPSFDPRPSGEDISTMNELVHDPEVGVNFAVLIIARLRRRRDLHMSATLFQRGADPSGIEVELEKGIEQRPLFRWICAMFGIR